MGFIEDLVAGNIPGAIGSGLGQLVGGMGAGLAEGAGATTNLDPGTLAQQNAFINALQLQAQGAGPNLAEAQLRQATSANAANAMAMAAAQRGVNPALAARQAQMAQAQAQQQAAGQAGMLRAQQQLATQQILGQNLYGLQGQQAGVNAANAQMRAQLAGGIMSGLSSAGAAMLGKPSAPGMETQEAGGAGGGLLSRSPNQVMMPGYAEGGKVAGKAEVKGDSPKNDKVKAMLSPGEIVIPRSIVNHPNAPQLAAKFVAQQLAGNKKKVDNKYAEGGLVEDASQETVPADDYNKYYQLAAQFPADPAKVEQLAKQYNISQPPSLGQKAVGFIESLAKQNQQAEQQKLAQIGIVPTSGILGNQPKQEATAESAVPKLGEVQPQPQAQQHLSDIYGYGATLGAIQKGIGQQQAGIAAEAQAQGALGKQQADIYEQYNKEIQARQANYETQYNQINDKIAQTNAAIAEGKIDPNKYLGEMSTGGKILSAISLIMGGIGGALDKTGKNTALDILQGQINRDIDAQKANLNQKNTLLSGYLKELGNLKDAEIMTRATMLSQVQNQVRVEEAKAQDPLAKARAQQLMGQLNLQYSQTVGQMTARKALMSEAGTAAGVPPETKIRALIPEGQQKEYYNELKDMQNTTKTRDSILGAFDKLNQIATVGKYATSPIQTSRQVDAIKKPLTAMLSKETAGRFTEQDAAMLDTIWPAAGDSPDVVKEKRLRLDKLISDKMNFPMLKTIGITPEGMSRYEAGGQKKIQLGAPVVK